MERLTIIGVFALLFGGFCVPSLAAQDSIEDDWVGGSNLLDHPPVNSSGGLLPY